MNQNANRKDGELSILVLVAGMFALVLIVIEVTYSNFRGMFRGDDAWSGILLIILQIGIVVGWVNMIKKIDDPNSNTLRWIVILAQVAAILLIMGHRSNWLDTKQVIIDSEKNKTEQTP